MAKRIQRGLHLVEHLFADLLQEHLIRVCGQEAERVGYFLYIERFYNRVRLHSALRYHSPVAYERQYVEQVAAA